MKQDKVFRETQAMREARKVARRAAKQNKDLAQLRRNVTKIADITIQDYAKKRGISYPQAVTEIAKTHPELFQDPAMWGREQDDNE